MANPEHLAILKKGVGVWNRWKAEHRDVVLNLGGVFGDPTQLRDSYLRDAVFFHEYLDWVGFARGNLDGAMFDGAWLRGSSFHSASLQQVSFIYANLLGMKFRDADLTGAELPLANCNGSAREIREYFIPDFSNWKDHASYQKAFERLLRDLKAENRKGV